MADVSLHLGDCLDVLQTLDANSVDSIVCDPPYGLSNGPTRYLGEGGSGGFMGKDWDHGVPGVAFWAEALRVAKPGAYLLAFGGDRTHHRLMCAIEDAGWEIRTCLYWIFGSGFPKSHQFHKKMNGDGEQWRGWGTALKPAAEIIVMARKPLEGTVAANTLKWGVGGLNIDGCRIEADEAYANAHYDLSPGKGLNGWGTGDSDGWAGMWYKRAKPSAQGRWPANLLLDEEAARLLDEQSGTLHTHAGTYRREKPQGRAGHIYGAYEQAAAGTVVSKGDSGGASRFFYVAKASKRDRDEGLEGMSNVHPTVKPTQLMRYLCRLVTPPNGTVLDPFAGSGSTGKAAVMEGFSFIGIEISEDYYAIAQRRIAEAQKQLPLLEMA